MVLHIEPEFSLDKNVLEEEERIKETLYDTDMHSNPLLFFHSTVSEVHKFSQLNLKFNLKLTVYLTKSMLA